jgi:hypothetical protein
VEADSTGYKWLQQHVAHHGLSTHAVLIRGFISNKKENISAPVWEAGTPQNEVVSTYTLSELLSPYVLVDILHCDIQGWEHVFVQDIALVNSKVKMVHFGTHNLEVHTALRTAFSENSWSVELDILPNMGVGTGKLLTTVRGPIRILWDGILRVKNTRFWNHTRIF